MSPSKEHIVSNNNLTVRSGLFKSLADDMLKLIHGFLGHVTKFRAIFDVLS